MNEYPPEIGEQAALWAVRLAEAPAQTRSDSRLQAWLQADRRHGDALRQAYGLWQGLGSLDALQQQRLKRVRRPGRLVQWGLAAMLMLSLGVGALHLYGDGADYRASREVRHITLADGSRIDLDAGSAIALAYDGKVRRVKLLQGAGWFSPAPVTAREVRPFEVEAAAGSVRAMGTVFMVQTAPEATTVGVTEHRVRVSAAGTSLLLEEHQAARYGAQGITRMAAWSSLDASDWRRGLLIFRQQPLAEAIGRINRYRSGTVVIVGEKLRQRRVSGVFRLDDLDHVPGTISASLGAKAVSFAGVTLLY